MPHSSNSAEEAAEGQGGFARLSDIHYAWWLLVASTVVVFGSLGLSRFSYTVILPSMMTGLRFDNTSAGVIATSNMIGYTTLAVLGGALASHFGPRVVIAVGLAMGGIGMVLTGLAGGVFGAAVFRFVTGMGSGASNVPVMGLLSAWFSPRRRGLAAGVAVTGSSFALIILGPASPRIIAAFGDSGWRVAWYVFGAATVVCAVIGWVVLRNRPEEVGLRPLGAEDEGKTESKGGSKAEVQDEAALAGAMPESGAAAEEPHQGLHWARVYRLPAVWHLGIVYVAFGFSYIIYVTFFNTHLVTEAGYSEDTAGTLFMIMGWFSLLCGVIWGAVSDAIGRKWAMMMVYLIHTVSFALFALWPATAGYAISAALFGITAWSIPAIMSATVGDVLGSRLAPAALGFITLFFAVGQMFGPAAGGVLADATGSFRPTFLLASGVALLGAVGAGLLRASSTRAV